MWKEGWLGKVFPMDASVNVAGGLFHGFVRATLTLSS